MVYVTAAEMKEIDRKAIEKYGVPAATLMENAGAAVAREAARLSGQGHALVVCGYGNNGGDGFVAARHLLKKGLGASVFLAGRPRPFSNETGNNFKALLESGCAPAAIYDKSGMERSFAALPECGVIIDSLFGIGIKGPLDGFHPAARRPYP
jgi:NAD(P)H-hydrate epimerase